MSYKKIKKLGVILLLSNRPCNIHVPCTWSFRLCFSMLPTTQTRDKETISEQELQLGWTSLLVHLGRRRLKKEKTFALEHLHFFSLFFFRDYTVTSTYIFSGLSVSELCHILIIQSQLASSILISTACLDTILKCTSSKESLLQREVNTLLSRGKGALTF